MISSRVSQYDRKGGRRWWWYVGEFPASSSIVATNGTLMGDVVASSVDRETRFRSPIHRCGSGWRRYDDTPVDYRSLARLDVYRSEIEGDREEGENLWAAIARARLRLNCLSERPFPTAEIGDRCGLVSRATIDDAGPPAFAPQIRDTNASRNYSNRPPPPNKATRVELESVTGYWRR